MEEQLNNILYWLRAYEATSGDQLDDSDLYDLKLAITNVIILKRHTEALDELTKND